MHFYQNERKSYNSYHTRLKKNVEDRRTEREDQIEYSINVGIPYKSLAGRGKTSI